MLSSLIKKNNVQWICHHLHLDKSKTISLDILNQSETHMKEKWFLMKDIKQKYNDKDLYFRMNSTIDHLYKQNCFKMKTFIDIDSIVGLNPLKISLKLKEEWLKKNVDIQIGTQPLDGLETDENINLFIEACKYTDFIGCLPSRDKNKEKHLDIVFSTALKENKDIEAHLDQCNIPCEKETELFCDFVEKYQYYGRARAVHCISLSCHDQEYQNKIAKKLENNGIGVIVCPSAALSMYQEKNILTPIHNSIAPVELLLKNNVKIGLGIDNIEDIFMPFCDGSFEFELRLLAESTRIYKPDILFQIANNNMGFNNL